MNYLAASFGFSGATCAAIYGLIAAALTAGTVSLKKALWIAACWGIGAFLLTVIAAVGLTLITKRFNRGKGHFTAW